MDQEPRNSRQPNRAMGTLVFRTGVALTGMVFMFINTNSIIYPVLASYNPFFREGATLFAVIMAALLVAASCLRPSLVRAPWLNRAALAFTLLYAVCCCAGQITQNPLLLFAGALSDSFAEAWLFVVACTAFSQLSAKARPIVATVACLAAYLLGMATVRISFEAAVLANGACLVILYIASWPLAREALAQAACAAPRAEAAVSNPFSFLPLNHLVFVTILFFGFVQGTSLALTDLPSTQLSFDLAPLALAALLVVPLVLKRPLNADILFSVCALLALAGIFLLPSTHYADSLAAVGAGAFLNAGFACFYLLLLLIVGSIIARNPQGSVTASSLVLGLTWTGVGAGASLGHGSLFLVDGNAEAVTWLSLALIMAFASYCFVALKRFSFEEAIRGIKTAQAVLAPTAPAPILKENSDAVAERFQLTKREKEVFSLLATGRSVGVICEKLGISINTVRFHAKNIYLKLEVHSQQELIDLVESFEES